MISKVRQAVIFAGGRGTRLKPFTDTCQKAMYPINGRPFLSYLISQVKKWGIEEVVLLLGYKAYTVVEYFLETNDTYRQIEYDGVKLVFINTPPEYDTEKRLKEARQVLDDNFLMMYCDNICPINYDKLVENYFKHKALIEFSAYENSDNYTKSNIKIDNNGKVTIYDKKRETAGLCGVDIGYAIVSSKVFEYMGEANDNFEVVVYPKLVSEGKLYATITKHRYYSIGSYERIKLTEEYLSNKKYIFLDRDGTLCERPKKAEYICKASDFVWIEGAREAVKKLYNAAYNIIIITNQAGIGRGVYSVHDFHLVQNKMKEDLRQVGAYIFDTFCCTHGWDSDCDCRKPKPGMLYEAQKKYSIDLSQCLMIGDDERDILTANNADMKGILVNNNYKLIDAVNDILKGNIKEYRLNDNF